MGVPYPLEVQRLRTGLRAGDHHVPSVAEEKRRQIRVVRLREIADPLVRRLLREAVLPKREHAAVGLRAVERGVRRLRPVVWEIQRGGDRRAALGGRIAREVAVVPVVRRDCDVERRGIRALDDDPAVGGGRPAAVGDDGDAPLEPQHAALHPRRVARHAAHDELPALGGAHWIERGLDRRLEGHRALPVGADTIYDYVVREAGESLAGEPCVAAPEGSPRHRVVERKRTAIFLCLAVREGVPNLQVAEQLVARRLREPLRQNLDGLVVLPLEEEPAALLDHFRRDLLRAFDWRARPDGVLVEEQPVTLHSAERHRA